MYHLVQTNTFQGIVITNGYQSFTVFTYHCGMMQWSGNAAIGFKANSGLFKIHELSGSNAKSIACQNLPTSAWSNVVYQLRKNISTLMHECVYGTFSTDLNELPFLNLNHNRTYLSSETEDSVSNPIKINGGFLFGSNQTTLYVCKTLFAWFFLIHYYAGVHQWHFVFWTSISTAFSSPLP